MRIPVDHGSTSAPRPEWRDVALGMLLLLAYLSASSAGLTILARALSGGD